MSEKMLGDALDELHQRLQKCSKDLGDLNSAFPATKTFLEARGLRSVNELDKNGLRELRKHLEDTLKLELAKKATPSSA